MKKLLVFLMVLVSFVSYGQYSKSGIVDVPNMKSEQIYRQSKEWFFNYFKSAKAVIDVDVPNEKLMGKGNNTIKYYLKNNPYLIQIPMDIIITIDIKDEKYRYNIETTMGYTTDELGATQKANNMIDSVMKVTPGSFLLGKKFREEMKENTLYSIHETNKQIKETIDGLEVILKGSIKEKKDNW